MTPTIAVIGDYNRESVAHQGIPRALALASDGTATCEWEWLHSSQLAADPAPQLQRFRGVWCVPGSPYANGGGVIAAIRYARERGVPFLGTCGGFQHAVLEYAETFWDAGPAGHAETDPGAVDPVIAPLSCALVEQTGEVRFADGARLRAIYGAPSAIEGYHCSYGVNARYHQRFEAGPLRVSARDLAGDIRAVELDGHPFFMGTLFQPERSGLEGRRHPLIRAFVAALAEAR